MRAHRGFTVVEVLTVIIIVGLVLAAIAMAMPLILNAPQAAQSQVDNVNTAALALYKMQRDVRQSNINGVYACTLPPSVTCSQPAPASSNPPVAAVGVVTADNGSGQFQANGFGAPKWTGLYVYWLTPNADGTSNELDRAYYPVGIPMAGGAPDPKLMPGVVTTAINAVVGASSYTAVAQDVVSISVAIDKPNNIVDLQIDGGTNKGDLSSLRLSGNSYVRN